MFKLQRSAASPRKVAVLAVVATLASLYFSLISVAQPAPDSVSISVSPQSLDTAVNPGKSTTNVFRITNGSQQAMAVESTPKNFVPSGNEGAIKIEEDDTPYSLAKWISVDPAGAVSIEPGQTADFNVTISVPENADPGGHFGSVVFRTIPTTQPGSAATISQEVAPVILVRVPGDAKEEAVITSFNALRAPITNSDDITFESIVRNNGNVHVKPTGTVSILNILGKQVTSLEVQSNNVIPGAERKMNAIWDDPGFRVGRYTARLTMVYGEENQIMTSQTSFYIFPVKQILPVIIVVATLLFLLYRIRRRLFLAAKILTGKHETK